MCLFDFSSFQVFNFSSFQFCYGSELERKDVEADGIYGNHIVFEQRIVSREVLRYFSHCMSLITFCELHVSFVNLEIGRV